MKVKYAVIALIRNENRIVLGKKPLGQKPYPNTWHLIGGGVEKGETCDDAIKREIMEETGLKIKNLRKAAWDTDIKENKHGEETHYVFLQYECDYESGELTPGDDIKYLEWVNLKDIEKYKLTEPSKIFFEKLGYL